jgi:hypothetical protein
MERRGSCIIKMRHPWVMRNFWISTLIVLLALSACTEPSDQSVQLRLLSASMLANGEGDQSCIYGCARIRYSITNIGDRKLLLFNVHGNIQLSDERPSSVCDSLWGPAVMRLNLYHDTTFVPTVLIFSFPGNRESERREKWNRWFTEGKAVLDQGETMEFTDEIDLGDYRLVYREDNDWNYAVDLAYVQFEREGIEKQIPTSIIENELHQSRATLFRGCAFSNRIELFK